MTATPRVLMVIWAYPPEFSGAGRQLATLAGELIEQGVRVQVLCSHAGRGDRTEQDGRVTVHRLGTNASGTRRLRRFGLRAFRWMLAHRREWDIVHVHGISPATYTAALAARLLGRPSLLKFTLAGDDDPITVGATRLGGVKLRVLGMMSGLIAISTALADAVAASPLAGKALWRVPNAVDAGRFSPPGPEERARMRREVSAEFGIPDGAPLVVFLGGIERRKGVDVLVEAWPTVLERVPEARLLLIGPHDHETADPAFKPALERDLLAAGAAGTVHFLGPCGRPERYLRCADLFAFTSRAEGFGTAVVEAEMAGVPAVVAQLPGITGDVMRPGETGLAVPQDDAPALAEALVHLLLTPELRERMGASAAQWAREHFSLPAVAAVYVDIYRALRGQAS